MADSNEPSKSGPTRRSSWMSSISSKFSSSTPAEASPAPKPTAPQQKTVLTPAKTVAANQPRTEQSNPLGAAYSPGNAAEETKEAGVPAPYTPRPVKESSPGFLSSLTRRLSSSSTAGMGKAAVVGQLAERRVMNVDRNRERCKVPDLNPAKLRRVAFCVDVEIAGFAGYPDSEPEDIAPTPVPGRRPSLSLLEQQTKAKKTKDAKGAKAKDMSEGAAMKNPQAVVEKKEEKEARLPQAVDKSADPTVVNGQDLLSQDFLADDESKIDATPINIDGKEPTRKKEKKKRSEEERKARKDKKRRHAEANGLVPMELAKSDDDDDSSPGSTPPGAATPVGKANDKPTTDPLRIYKRCSQLRETSALRKVCDQISAPSSTLVEAPGTVAVLDLTGLWMEQEDIITLGDWLAVVPVRKLVLEDCGLTDESVRVILSGLLGCKTADQARHNKKLAKQGKNGPLGEEMLGVIEKISLKDNNKIGAEGWRHIGLFVHMSKSLRAIDLSGIPMPDSQAISNGNVSTAAPAPGDFYPILSKALSERLGGSRLEELVVSDCKLSTEAIGHVVDATISCGLRRLGLASNNMDEEGLRHVIRYLVAGQCEGLDIGGNNLDSSIHLLAESFNDKNSLYALSLADCSLTPPTLNTLLPSLLRLNNFRFIDLSHNRGLFATQPDSLSVLRRYLPQMKNLKRIHLVDVDLSPDHAIALTDVLPDIPSLAHLNILENPKLSALASAKDAASQEEAAALYASMMAAVRVSKTIVAIDIEVPAPDSSEVVKALASQVVAYGLQNIERGPLMEWQSQPNIPARGEKPASEILLHILGPMDGYEDNADFDQPAPDDDYVVGGTGIVKALGVCLANPDFHSRVGTPGDGSPTDSGTASPRKRKSLVPANIKPRDVSKNLLESARKIRMRLGPALIREDRAGNDMNYSKLTSETCWHLFKYVRLLITFCTERLQFLDTTLQRMIQRFEEQYPETRLTPANELAKEPSDNSSDRSSLAETSNLSGSVDAPSTTITRVLSDAGSEEDYSVKLSRTGSNTSLHARMLTSEEGRMHKFGQQVRREMFRPQFLDYAHGTTNEDPPESPHITALREKLELLKGDDIRKRVEEFGPDRVLEEMGADAEELLALEKQDPSEFEKFRESQMVAHLNTMRMRADSGGSVDSTAPALTYMRGMDFTERKVID